MRFTNGFGVTKSAILAVVVTFGLCLGLSALTTDDSKHSKPFEFRYPDLSRLTDRALTGDDPPCAIEAQNLAVALAELNTAQQNAQQAYEAWVNCTGGGNPNPNPNPNPNSNTFSILQSSN